VKLCQVIVFVKDLPTMQAFYRDVLGLAPIDEDPQFARYDAGAAVVALHPLPPEIAGNDPFARREDSWIKVTFHADDVDAERARLVAAGVTMDEIHRWGAIAYCDGVDPEGNVFQISTR
jgi:catechol 2,3-dioxygenase-like lactoylglutathione lyase family enzyme